MTLSVLSGLSGLSVSYVSMIENGQRPLDRYSNIVALAGALRVPPAELAPGMPAELVTVPAKHEREAGEQPRESGEIPPVGKRLAQLRRARGLKQEELAERAGVSVDVVRKLEQGARDSARLATLTALARALGVRTAELFEPLPDTDGHEGDSVSESAGTDNAHIRAAVIDGDVLRAWRRSRGWDKPEMARQLRQAVGNDPNPAHDALLRMIHRWEREGLRTERYEFLYAAALEIDADLLRHGPDARVPQASVNNPRVIQALDVIGNDHLGSVTDSIAHLVDHYAEMICVLPPADVYNELLSVRSYASGVVERAGRALQRKDLIVATGWLSNLLAVAACDMGEHAAARVWCSDAERRSQDVRYPELAAWAVLTRAMIAFYQGQSHKSVSLAAQGQKIVPIGTVIHAKLAVQQMRAAAMADAASMAHARSYAAKAIAKLPSDAKVAGAFSIKLGEDPPYTATSLLFVGNFSDAVSATQRVIRTVYNPRKRGEDPSGYARSLLILALAQAGVGRLDAAVAAGHAALSCSRPAWPTMVLAGKLDQALSRDYGSTRESNEYHHRYLATASQQTGVSPSATCTVQGSLNDEPLYRH